MALTSELISQFVKATTDTTETKKESTVYGTVVIYEGSKYVKLDGSDLLTPIDSMTVVEDGDRVMVTIKNHSATVTGNVSSPSASDKSVQQLGTKITEFEIVIADKVSTKELDAEVGRIDELVADNVLIKESLTASEGYFDELRAKDAEIEGKLTADEAEIETLKTTKLDASVADLTFATIESLKATDAEIYNLKSTYGEFEVLATDKFTAYDASIQELETGKLSATDADLKYANIDFTNIGSAAMEYLYAQSGLIENVVIKDGVITGEIVGVTIKGNLIEGGTVKADKLVLKGEDGLYYKLNVEGGATTSEQVTEEQLQNGFSGDILIKKSITADKIHVSDLVAFDATIGGFNITESAIYSGVKESVNNTTRGLYMDNDGQVVFGDDTNFLKYYKDRNGVYKLEISAENVLFGVGGKKSVNDAINEMVDSVVVGARNLIRNSVNMIFDDYYFTAQEMVVTHDGEGNVTVIYSPITTSTDGIGNVTVTNVTGTDDGAGNVVISVQRGD